MFFLSVKFQLHAPLDTMALCAFTNAIVNVTALDPAWLHLSVCKDSLGKTVRENVIALMVQHVTGIVANVNLMSQMD